jgi:flagellar motor protein MotB
VTETLEHTAQRIAEQGRSALLARLRPAFTEAVRAHADVLNLDEDQLEQMVQRAADRADGLQWRRALADVATEQLGITLGEALSHPAVARAQAIVGAPSYEDSLAALGPVPGLEARPAQPAGDDEEDDEAADETEEEPEAPDGEADGEAEAQSEAEATAEVEEEAEPEEEEAEAQAEAEDAQPLRLVAVHLGGIANLDPAERGIALHLSDDGLDIARGSDELLGRLRWPEIRSLDVTPPRGLRRRRRAGAHLVIRTRHGDATFEIPEISSEELSTQLKPLLQRHTSG